ncbi:polymorphic toxin-type HINT domain-containing protein [Catellatospora sp. IY07-71]|uniref:polymorphic toxin-type HINT domain-containing protein n=1 Tax=Catellatospora sp. IY07-71 TaxID=2728827 RepID=UPI001BB3ED9C|nr:polymorphic toxin-type HINT domain-containing protein [Catellatospora sp. IY07-71]
MANVAVGRSPASARQKPEVRQHQPKAARWPSARSAVVELPQGQGRLTGVLARVDGPLPKPAQRVRAAGTPVSLTATTGSPDAVRAEVLDRAAAKAAGRDVLVRVSPTRGATAGSVVVSLDISQFKSAYGADWSDRLRLTALSNDCGPESCDAQPLATSRSGDTLTATVPMSAAGTMVALSAGSEASSGSGDFGATPLAASATWSAGGSSGGFSWNYGLRVPPSLGGPSPNVSLAYSSQAVDGQMAATNNQPSWAGIGFDWAPGFIERRYIGCSEDMEGTPAPNNTQKTSDLCWRGSNATLSLNGRATELFYNSTDKLWHGRSEDGSKVELKYGASNGDAGPAPGTSPSPGDSGEHWVVTTTNGTKYYFGLNRLQGWTAGKPETNSVQTVPVFGNHPADPCYSSSGYTSSDCLQAYRWNLDYVVDTHGNTMSLWWGKDANEYGMNLSTTDLHSYTRDAYLKRIDYGTHQRTLVNNVKTDTVFTAKPVPAQVKFETGDRCLSNCATHDDNWPDTPWDLECTASPCDNHSPSFWSTRRLREVTTWVWDAANSAHKLVDKWGLTHSFPDPGDGTKAGMWLEHISHSGHVGGTPSTPVSVALPDIDFDPVMLPNRVDTALKNGLRPMNWARMAAINSETGGVIGITYAPNECVAGALPTAHTNTKRCYPVRWTPEDLGGTPGQEITDWFHKYVVAQVTESDTVVTGAAASPPKITRYEYVGGAAWRYAEDSAFTKDKYRTWNQFRGYGTVRTLIGDGADQTRTDAKYFRGLHGDKTSPSGGTDTVTLTDSKGLIAAAYPTETVYDYDEFAGQKLENIVYDSPTGSPISGTVTKPWRSASTASRTIDGQTIHARFVNTSDTWTWAQLDTQPSSDRVTRKLTTYDSLGMVVSDSSFGDLAKTGDERCTATDYKRNTGAHLMVLPSRVRMWALTCADALTPNRTFTKDEIVSEVRSFYDDHAWDEMPTVGEVTRVDSLKDWVSGAFVPLTTSRSSYDDYGRKTDTWDVDNQHVTVAYTPAADGPVTSMSETDALGTATSTLEPAWGAPTLEVDVNGRRTEVTYDPLGRTEKVWRPGRSKALYGSTPSAWYLYSISKTAPSVVETRTLSPNGTMISAFIHYDGLMRERQTQAVKANGTAGAMVTDVFFDTAGRTWRTFGPYPVASAPSGTFSPHPESDFENLEIWSKTQYDSAGRKTEEIRYSKLAEQWRTSTRYPSADRIEVTPPTGGTAVTTVRDVQDRVTKIRQHHGPTPASTYDETAYDYDLKGNLKRVTNSLGTKWEYEYDILARQIEARDPDKGTTTTTYDDAGRVTSVTDSRVPAVTVRTTYDTLGRKTGLYQGTVTAANRLAKWEYDGLATAKGMLTSSTRYVGGESGAAYTNTITALSSFGTPSQRKISIPATEVGLAGDYLYDYGYKANGAPASVRLPAIGSASGYNLGWETQTTTYTANGAPQKLSVGATDWLVTDTTYTEHGELGVITLRDLTTNPQVQIGHYFDAETRRLDRVWTTRDTAPTSVSDVSLDYDDAGTVTQVAEASAVAGVETQCFSHDYLRRLKEAWTLASGNCGAVPQAFSAVGGVEKYWLSWEIDGGGNRTKQVKHTAGGDVTTKYVYPAPTAAQPHTLLRTTDAANVTTANYSYDGTGNTRCRPAGTALNTCPSGSGSQVVTWDAEGRAASSADTTGTTSYIYDADGARLIRKDPQGKTLYLPGQELRVDTAGSLVISCTRYYSWAGMNIASRASSLSGNAVLTWMVADRQNSANITIQAAGTQAVAVKRQDPYGNQRGSTVGSWLPTIDKGFVGGTNDNTGLVHIGAREYDAKLGRFVSVDPVMDLLDPQQWNAYSYSNNSPVTFSDPTGLIMEEYANASHPPPGPWGDKIDDRKWSPCPWGMSPRECERRYENNTATWEEKKPTFNPDAIEMLKFGFSLFPGVGDAMDVIECAQDPSLLCVGTTIIGFVPVAGDGIKLCIRHCDEALDAAGDLAKKTDGAPNLPSCKDSFDPKTLVLLADGTTKEIEDVREGDVVAATDPESDVTAGKVVQQVHVNEDRELTLLTVLTKRGERVVIDTTWGHPFWSETRQEWVRAKDLVAGEQLLARDGTMPSVQRVDNLVGAKTMYNLSVAELHTYYVLAGDTPVLVHNTGPACVVPGGVSNLRDGAHMTTNDAMDTAVEFLGAGYRDEGGGRFVSKDGLRQVRLTDADLAHRRQNPHINFETYSQPIKKGVRSPGPISNIHIFLPEEPGWHLP